jgi:hypothetical protein
MKFLDNYSIVFFSLLYFLGIKLANPNEWFLNELCKVSLFILSYFTFKKHNHNTLCIIYPLRIFKGEELVFPKLKLIIHIK